MWEGVDKKVGDEFSQENLVGRALGGLARCIEWTLDLVTFHNGKHSRKEQSLEFEA